MKLKNLFFIAMLIFLTSSIFGGEIVDFQDNTKLGDCVLKACKSTTGCTVKSSTYYRVEGADKITYLNCSNYGRGYGIVSLDLLKDNLPNLKYLNLSYNQLNYTSLINKLKNLTTLSMNSCGLKKLPLIPKSVTRLEINNNLFGSGDNNSLIALATGYKRITTLYVQNNALVDKQIDKVILMEKHDYDENTSKDKRYTSARLRKIYLKGNGISQSKMSALKGYVDTVNGGATEDQNAAHNNHTSGVLIDWWIRNGGGIDWRVKALLENVIGPKPGYVESEWIGWIEDFNEDYNINDMDDLLRVIFDGPYSDMYFDYYLYTYLLRYNYGLAISEVKDFSKEAGQHHRTYLINSDDITTPWTPNPWNPNLH